MPNDQHLLFSVINLSIIRNVPARYQPGIPSPRRDIDLFNQLTPRRRAGQRKKAMTAFRGVGSTPGRVTPSEYYKLVTRQVFQTLLGQARGHGY